MERYEFYNNMFKYKKNNEDIIEHGIGDNIIKKVISNATNKVMTGHSPTYKRRRKPSTNTNTNGSTNYGDYYYKIDNFYKDGSAKYFKTKDEYDTWTKNQAQAQGAINKQEEAKHVNISNKETKTDREHANKVNNKLNYSNNKAYSIYSPSQKGEKETENSAKRDYVKEAQYGREAAIRNSSKPSAEEVEKIYEKDRQYIAKENLKKDMKEQIALTFKKIKEKEKEKTERLNNAKPMDVKKSMNDLKNKMIEMKLVTNNPVSKAVYKISKDKEKAVNDYIKNNTPKLNADLPAFKKEKLTQLNDNTHDIDKFLRKVSSGDEITARDIKNIQKNPLYNSVISVIKESNDDFNATEFFKKSKNVDQFKQAYKALARETEDRIDKLTIKDLAASRV